MIITSIKDPNVVEARNLQSSSYRKTTKKALLYGKEQIQWAIENHLEVESIFTHSKSDLSFLPIKEREKVFTMSEGILKKVSGTNYLVSFLAIVETKEKAPPPSDFVVVMDQLQDFGNIGSIIRTSKGFSIDDFIFVNMQTDPFMRKIIDASRGKVFDSHIKQYETVKKAIESLKKQNYQIIVTSPHAKHLQSQTPLSNKKIALVIGNESFGVSDVFLNEADIAIKIPMNDDVESFNVSVAAGISIYELTYKQVLMMLKEKIFINFGRQVGVTGNLIRKAFNQEISKNTDLSGMQVILLMIMHLDQSMSLSQIEKDMSLYGKALSDFLAKLKIKNLIEETDAFYKLTEKGKEFLAELWPIIENTHKKILKELTKEEITQLTALLTKVQKGCNNVLKEES